ncbi:hypothetical protein SG34_018415 [Thalassomonas viridans]|uniref:Uncharacterized protein n=1 Tax=Thalassomonas viridans TaxID=137584 RepID=A0AAE9YZL5_9GAMM|nr:hypothetical protein [Thalassomonas viridans]WDE03365.1 hypothetical protein SG34_018415 [Thalassomonas viridans]
MKARDVNMAGLLMIIILERSLEEVIYLIHINFDIKVFVYLCALVVLYKLKYDQLVTRLCMPVLVLAVLAELYWWYSGYDGVRIHLYVLMLLLNLVTRHLLFMRLPITDNLVEGAKSLPLDWKFCELAKWSIFVLTAMLLEYLVRHLTAFNPLYIYNAFTPLMHAIAVTMLYYLTDDYLRSRFILTA